MKDGSDAMPHPLRILVVGAGAHSRGYHLPALVRYRRAHPDRVAAVAVCDLDLARARSAVAAFGLDEALDDLDVALRQWLPDACLAVTPVAATAAIAQRVLAARVPVLIEKPPGSSVAEAESLVQAAEAAGVPAMVSMNRRFDPVLRAAKARVGSRPLLHLRATMCRDGRTEADFVTTTSLHCVDAVRMLGGDVDEGFAGAARPGGGLWRVACFRFASGASGLLEILPSCGANAERYELFGEGFRILAMTPHFDDGELRCWEAGRTPTVEVFRAPKPDYELNGTVEETAEFLDSLWEGRTPRPSLADVFPSVKLAHALDAVR